ncbi:N-acetylmuramoyl-L-alanine amidase family protein [Alkaliphilus sp. MSJ-5]|uniref:N-acetylmuramoyl-L-alanine amidase family protein n=1 Tax=Alkaliphilus flagellatus TaxID=2841507 RepID=A0ABS6G6P1_9FIRM|nr:N-acetylmuramoyl-L-alanine amidase family protein [Alkaliphilus flagellatus]MBU5678044.1 N-acetylmuramoyl-L-alanine amidase family protein [Alkaliphilus flagellatus]
MRKLIPSILVLIILITSLTVSFADGSLNKILLKENGIGKNYQVVNLKIDGKTVKSADVPPIIYPLNNQERTLVPLRVIIEHLGDKLNADIGWDEAKQEVKVKTKDKEILLKIDSPVALVNGVQKRLPDNIPAKLLAIGDNSRTMVPVRFFADELGLSVGWDEKTVTASIDMPKVPEKETEEEPIINPQPPQENVADVTDVRVEMNGSIPQIRIKTSKQIDYKQFKLANPERLVIDLNNAKLNLSDRNKLESNGTLHIQSNSEVIKGVRVSQFQNDPFVTRVVMELGKSTEHEISFDEKSGEIVINFTNYIRNVKKEIMNTKEVIVIEGDSVADYSIMQLSDPERLVVDIKGGVLHSNFKNNLINIDGKVAKTIRVSEHTPENNGTNEKNVRVVIDFQENSGYNEAYAEVNGNKLYLHLEGEPFKAIKYEETGWTTSRFTLKGSTVTRYSIGRQLASNLIEVTVPKKDIELELASLNINDHIIKSINISEDLSQSNYNVKLELQDSVEHKLLSSEQSQDLVLELNNKNAKYREMLVVIDPGHGGRDPGTTSSILKMHESEVVLDISTRLNKLLTEAGFRTYMTRVDNLTPNTKLELQDRADVANSLNADIFISIHANAAEKVPTANGLENFYHPSDIRGKKLAEVFQSEMIKNLDINSRGAKPNNLSVLRNTTMPAVLTETGFLTNAGDEAKLATSEYRQQVAEAMFKATVRYFEETR